MSRAGLPVNNVAFRLLGGAILVASCLFLAWQVRGAWAQLSGVSISTGFVAVAAIAAVAYTGLLSLLAVAWWWLVRALLPEHIPALHECWRIFMRMQALKYLPGNVFHYLGRVELLGREGVPRNAALLSLLHESILLAVAALLLGAGGLWQAALALGEFETRFMVVAAVCLAGLPLLWMYHRRRSSEWHEAVALERSWLVVGALYALFFLSMTGLLWLLAQLAGHALPTGLCLAATTVPWLLGTVTPGAPGGLGVREAAMLILLKPVMSPADGLLLVIALRLVTLFGDLVALPISYAPFRGHGRASR